MSDLTVPVYCNRIDELIPFANKEAALQWVNDLDTSGTPILVPFKEQYDQIQFLKPGIKFSEANKKYRIIGAANEVKKNLMDSITGLFDSHPVPHLDHIEGETITIAEHNFIIIYERGNKQAGKKFFEFFEKEKEDLLSKVKITQTNEGVHINETKFIQDLSKLALNLDIKSGMCYFLINKDNKTHVYRHTFKEDLANEKIKAYLFKEKDRHQSEHKIIENNKFQDHHIGNFLKDWFKWTVFAAITAVGAGLILGLFIPPPIGTIAAALVAVVTFVGISGYGFYRADKNNSTTIEFGNTEFETESQNTFYARLKQIFNRIPSLFNKKIVNTLATPVEANDHHHPTVETEKPISARNVAHHFSTNQFFSKMEKILNSDEIPSSFSARNLAS